MNLPHLLLAILLSVTPLEQENALRVIAARKRLV
jgi:hypothetical protein